MKIGIPILLLVSFVCLQHAGAQGIAFFYTGNLNDNGSPASGRYDLRFTLYDAETNGNAAGIMTNTATSVSNGVFAVTLNFGNVFDGTAYWLEIAARTNGGGALMPLSPRQPILPIPYSIYAANSGNAATAATANTATIANSVSATNIVGTLPLASLSGPVITNNQNGVTLNGTFSGNGTLPWTVISGTNVQALPNRGYLVTNDAPVTIALPVSPNPGDLIRVSGTGTGGWTVRMATNQSVIFITNLAALNLFWTPQNSGIHGWACVASSADGTKLVAADSGGQIYTSTDSGANWTPQNSGSQSWNSLASSSDGTRLAVTAAPFGGGQIFTSGDSGVTWTTRNAGTRNWQSIASSADGTKLVAVANNGGKIYTSIDSGLTWRTNYNALAWKGVASSADGTKLVAIVNGGQTFTSTDSGTNWTGGNLALNWQSVASSADGAKLVAAVNGGQIYTSTDSGATWTARNINRSWNSVASSADGTKLVAITSDGQTYTSADSGVTWMLRDSRSHGWTPAASSDDGSKLVIAAGADSVYTVTDTSDFRIIGRQGTAIELQYVGNGKFLPISYTGILRANFETN